MQMIIYTLDDRLFVHSHSLISSGKILIMDNGGKIINSSTLVNTDFFSCRLPPDKKEYLIRVEAGQEVYQKQVYLFVKDKTGNGTKSEKRVDNSGKSVKYKTVLKWFRHKPFNRLLNIPVSVTALINIIS